MKQKNFFYFIKKIITMCIMLLILSIVIFFISRMTPGDPLQSFYGDATQSMTIQQLDGARHRLGLDAPLWTQYTKWLSSVLQGDFGISLKYKRPVLDVVSPLLGNTFILGGLSYLIIFLTAIALALICARYEDTCLDKWLCRIGTAAYYTPAFWLGTVLALVFSVNLQWLPSSGAYAIGHSGDLFDRLRHLLLPLIVMVASHVWYYAYMIRNKLLDEVRREYVLLARSKGFSKRYVLTRHCLRNVLPTILNVMAIAIPHILSGTYVAEAVFNYPGIGLLSVSSAKYHDYNMLMLIVMLTGILVVVSSILAQCLSERIDHRMQNNYRNVI